MNLRHQFQGMHFRSQVCIAQSLDFKVHTCSYYVRPNFEVIEVSVLSHDKACLFHIIDLVIGSICLSYAPLGLSIHVVASCVLAL